MPWFDTYDIDNGKCLKQQVGAADRQYIQG